MKNQAARGRWAAMYYWRSHGPNAFSVTGSFRGPSPIGLSSQIAPLTIKRESSGERAGREWPLKSAAGENGELSPWGEAS